MLLVATSRMHGVCPAKLKAIFDELKLMHPCRGLHKTQRFIHYEYARGNRDDFIPRDESAVRVARKRARANPVVGKRGKDIKLCELIRVAPSSSRTERT